MYDLSSTYSVRDPIHGLIDFNALEWEVINSAPFHRLRRIKQLAWTDYIYPGAGHTRFEHSLGVCHIASKMFDSIVNRDAEILRSSYGFGKEGFARQRQILRLAALCHDLGHGPFSHAAEDAFPEKENGERYVHEEYSGNIVRFLIKDMIENHPYNRNNFGIKISDIASMFDGAESSTESVVWKEIVSGQMDADRMDYLLRDSFHAGVSYGRYDLDRVINTICLCEDNDGTGHFIGVEDTGLHAVEGLLLARYMMFTQVYYHKTRSIYDYHYDQALKHILKQGTGCFPSPEAASIKEYLEWDDWKVQGCLYQYLSNDNCRALVERQHLKLVHATTECPSYEELQKFEEVKESLTDLSAVSRDAKKSWYKFQKDEIRVRKSLGGRTLSVPLATLSPVVKGLQTVNQRRLYVSEANRGEARKRLANI